MRERPSEAAIDAARRARHEGFFAVLGSGGGIASPGVMRVGGPDAARFLHSQTTNNVVGLEPGDGHWGARVQRTGHLLSVFTVHRLGDDFLLILPAAEVPVLRAAFDAFLFADDVRITDETSSWRWVTFQGPHSDDAAERVFGPLGFEPWGTLPDASIRPLRRFRDGAPAAGCLAVRRSVTGDRGTLIGMPTDVADSVLAGIRARTDWVELAQGIVGDVLEILRIEAGHLRVDLDAPDSTRLLPETGLEQHAVSYTKGCYLGQEVIARVRTYGSVQTALRGLVTDVPLERLADPGTELGDGTRVGQLASATWSPLLQKTVAFAYLHRDVRTPGTTLSLPGGGEATVVLLPFYSAPDDAGRVAWLYDAGIRAFAAGDSERALRHLEDALRLDPSFMDAYEAVGILLGRGARFHEAIDFFRRLEELAPDEPLVNTNLSLFYMKLGDKATAEEEAAKVVQKQFRKSLAAKGRSTAEVAAAELESRRRDAERKKRMFTAVLEIDPVDPVALFGLGNALVVLGDLAGADEALSRAIEADGKNSAVYLARGKALEALSQPEAALAVYAAGMAVASQRGDLAPLREMEHRSLLLRGREASTQPHEG